MIAAVGAKVYARRFKQHAVDADQIVLIAVSAGPYRCTASYRLSSSGRRDEDH